MRTSKIILALGLIIALTACEQKVAKKDYDQVMTDYQSLKESIDLAQSLNISQAAVIDSTMAALAQISGRTVELKMDIESGEAQLSQAESINEHIQAIKEKLEKLEKQAANNSVLRKTVSNLKVLINEKEKEISSLKQTIAAQHSEIQEQQQTITTQSDTISSQKSTILKQNRALKEAVDTQAYQLYKAGCDFEELADTPPVVTRNKNRIEVRNYTLQMYTKAIHYFEQALTYGYTEASARIDAIKTKMSSAE